jgi:BolA protein
MEQQITDLLTQALLPTFIEVDNESYLHSSGKGGHSHFKITLVSDAFVGKTLVARHRMVQSVIKATTDGVVHALGIHTYTPEEWKSRGGVAPDSPTCAGHKGH